MEIKILCGCGSKYKFDVEPQNGSMPCTVKCPVCGADGTPRANEIIAASSATTMSATPVASVGGARLAVAGHAPAAAHSSAGLAVATPPPPPPAPAYNPNAGLLGRTSFFVKERVGLLKLVDTYDIVDPMNGQPIGIAKEEPPTWAKWLRLVVEKGKLPTAVNIYEQEGFPPVVSMRRGFTLFRSKVRVFSADGQQMGYFKSKLISIGGGFNVFDNRDQQVAEVKGNWKGWDFKFINKNGREIGTVTKKWAGFGKELFTSADNYIISLTDSNNPSPAAAALLLAAGIAIDTVYKEKDSGIL